MKVTRRHAGSEVEFVLEDVDPRYRKAVGELAFRMSGGEFVRSFPADALHLETAWANFARHAEEMVLQAAGIEQVPWQDALRVFLQRVEGENVEWWLAGSGALAVRGVDLVPRDLDVIVDPAGARVLADLFADVLMEPLVRVTDWFCEWWCRAFPGARVEWVGGVGPAADAPETSDFGPTAAGQLETVRWEGFKLRVPPIDLQLAVTERRGLSERVAKIREELT
jgi:hypothetical protein